MTNDRQVWENLAIAIVEQAIDDYKDALLHRRRKQIAEIEAFLESDYYRTLCGIDGAAIKGYCREMMGMI